MLFIKLEIQLERFALAKETDLVQLAASGLTPPNYLSNAGRDGLLLYGCMILWWFSGCVIAKGEMPKRLLVFHCMEFINSAFIYVFGGALLPEGWAIWMLATVILLGLAAAYMLMFVLSDVMEVAMAAAAWFARFRLHHRGHRRRRARRHHLPPSLYG